MRLVLTYTVSDGCSYSFDVTLPIEYDSEESFICDFESALDLAINKKECCFKFLNNDFDVDDLYDNFSKIKKFHTFTLDSWFNELHI